MDDPTACTGRRLQAMQHAEALARTGTLDWRDRPWWSSEAHALLGHAPDVVSPSVDAFVANVHDDERAHVRAALDHALASGEPHDLEFRLRGGERRRLRLLDRIGSLQDVTVLPCDEHDPHVNAHILDDAQAIAKLGSWVWRTGQGTISWSPTDYRIMGRPLDHVPSVESFDSQLHPDDRAQFLARREHTLRTGETEPSEVRIVHPDGEVRRVIVHGRMVDGPEPWLYGIVQDVTERRDLEDRLRHNETLHALSDLSGEVAHHFNNLLTVVLVNLELSGSPSPEIQDAKHAATTASELTKHLLSLARLNHLPLVPVDLDDTVEQAAAKLRGEIPSCSVRVVGRSSAWVLASRAQLTHAIVEMVRRGRERPPTQVEIRSTVDPGGSARVEISDDGPELDPSLRGRFRDEAFPWLDAQVGNRLWLATVHGAVVSMNGTLELEPDAGHPLRLHLPEVARPDAPPTGTELKGRRVLVVEREASVRRLVERLLTRLGMEVRGASDAREAVAALESPLDLVVCSVTPQGIGREVEARFSAARPDLPLLFVTGAVNQQEWLARYPVLTKPFLPRQLEDAVYSVLAFKPGR